MEIHIQFKHGKAEYRGNKESCYAVFKRLFHVQICQRLQVLLDVFYNSTHDQMLQLGHRHYLCDHSPYGNMYIYAH